MLAVPMNIVQALIEKAKACGGNALDVAVTDSKIDSKLVSKKSLVTIKALNNK